ARAPVAPRGPAPDVRHRVRVSPRRGLRARARHVARGRHGGARRSPAPADGRRRAVRRLSRAVLAVSLSLGVVAPGPALATTYLALGPAAVFERADAVLTARVADVTARVDGDLVWSVVTLEVMEWLTEDPETGEDEAPREEV